MSAHLFLMLSEESLWPTFLDADPWLSLQTAPPVLPLNQHKPPVGGIHVI